ncbi:MAG: UvrD-helicase domain-containing protein [Ferrimicrobium sp.]
MQLPTDLSSRTTRRSQARDPDNAMKLTADQNAAVTADSSVAIIAGAGTGKTTTIAERYLAHLQKGNTPLSMVAITFTNAAASELRRRIRRRVVDERDLDDSIVTLVDAAQIGTIDSLCAAICREFPTQAQVPIDFAVIDHVADPLWASRAVMEALDVEEPASFDLLPFSILRSIAETALSDPTTAEHAFSADREALRQRLEQIQLTEACNVGWERWIERLSSLQGASSDSMEIQRRQALTALRELPNSPSHSFAVLNSIALRGGSEKRWSPGELAVIKELLRELRGTVRSLPNHVLLGWTEVDTAQNALMGSLHDLLSRVLGRVDEAKRKARILEYADLEIHAARALEDPEVVSQLRSRWQIFLIDEFQDTNSLQLDLLAPLTRDATVTIVGDPKQSIYGFRGAQEEVFERESLRITMSGGDRVVLRESFRSHEGVVDVVNRTFSTLMDTFDQLSTSIPAASRTGPFVRLYTPAPEDSAKRIDRLQNEARAVAALIANLIEDNYLVRDPLTGHPRPVQPRDIALLSRKWSPLDAFAAACEEYAIPSAIIGGGSLLDTPEARDAISLAQFLADPTNEIALLALLRSPLVGLSDLDLLTVARTRASNQGWWNYIQNHLIDDDRVRVLIEMATSTTSAPPSVVFESAAERLGYPATLRKLPGARRRLADWEGMIAIIRDLSWHGHDLTSIAEYFEDLETTQTKLRRPAIDATNAVSLLTVHGAKGLEWPIVIVADLGAAERAHTEAILFDPRSGVGLKPYTKPSESIGSGVYSLFSFEKQARERAETRRIWYVAMTRARDLLILSSSQNTDTLEPLIQAVTEAGVALETFPQPIEPTITAGMTNDTNTTQPLVQRKELLAPIVVTTRPITPAEVAARRWCDIAAETSAATVSILDKGWQVLLVDHLIGRMLRSESVDQLPGIPRQALDDATSTASTLVKMVRADESLRDARTPPVRDVELEGITIRATADLLTDQWVGMVTGDASIDPAAYRTEAAIIARIFERPRFVLVIALSSRLHWWSKEELTLAYKEALSNLRYLALNEHNIVNQTDSRCRHCDALGTCLTTNAWATLG